jgi:hypothetical protein
METEGSKMNGAKTHKAITTLAGTEPRLEIKTITPELAKKWLALNTASNRRISKRTVDAYAQEMTRGRWQLTHQAIAFNQTGELVDGQHRLHAIVVAGVPIKAYVSTGLPLEYNAPIDQGYNRRVDQIMGKSPRFVSIVRGMHYLETADLGKSFKTQVGLIEELAKRHGSCVEQVMARAPSGWKTPATFMSCCAFAYAIDPNKMLAFVEQVHTGELLTRGDPAYTLRKWFLKPENRTPKENLIGSCAAIAALLKGSPIEKLPSARGEIREGASGYLYICQKRRKLKLEGTPVYEITNPKEWAKHQGLGAED